MERIVIEELNKRVFKGENRYREHIYLDKRISRIENMPTMEKTTYSLWYSIKGKRCQKVLLDEKALSFNIECYKENEVLELRVRCVLDMVYNLILNGTFNKIKKGELDEFRVE